MFGKKKNKKEKKVEKIFADSQNENSEELVNPEQNENPQSELSEEEIMMGMTEADQEEDSGYTEFQKNKIEKLSSVRDKISKILKSSNIEIVDENLGDEYVSSDGTVDGVQTQQDYDSLKALFGGKDKGKGKELTLTIDDFDYSHTGQYIEEFDLMHLKGIKRVRIHKKHSKWVKRLSIAASIVAVIAVGIVLALQFTRKQPVVLTSISLNQSTGVYYVNESFDYSGLYIYANYSDGTVRKIKLENSHYADAVGGTNEISGGEIKFKHTSTVNITFTYGGRSITYVAEVKNKVVDGLMVSYDDSIFMLELNDVVKFEEHLMVFNIYRDNDLTEILDLSVCRLLVNGVEYGYNSAKGGFVLDSLTGPIDSIKVKYGSEFELALDKTTNVVEIRK